MGYRSATEIRQTLGWALVAALTAAALTAIGALVGGSFDDTDWRVLGTSLGFTLFSATGAAGASARLRSSRLLQLLGAAAAIASVVGFALLVGALWIDDEADGLWRAFGCAGIVAIAASHACLVLGSRRQGDSETVRALVAISLLAGAVDATAIIIPVSGLAEYDDDGSPQFIAICLVVLVLTTVLPPILRRLQPRPATSARAPAGPTERLAGEVVAIADRIDALGRGPGLRTPEIRRETEALRRLARRFSD